MKRTFIFLTFSILAGLSLLLYISLHQKIIENDNSNENLRVIAKFSENIISGTTLITKTKSIQSKSLRELFKKYNVKELHAVFRNRYNERGKLKSVTNKNSNKGGLNTWQEVLLSGNKNANEFVELLKKEKGIIKTYIEKPIFLKSFIAPDDPTFQFQWHLNSIDHPNADINAEQAWDINRGRNDVIVAVCDGGVDYTHPDLDPGDRSRVIAGYDSGEDDYDPMDDLPDLTSGSYAGHGTMVAGVIGAIPNNDYQVAGVMWNCKIMPVKMVREGTVRFPFAGIIWDFSTTAFPSDVADAIDYAVNNGANVINLSYGFRDGGQTINEIIYRTPLLYDAILNAYNNNVVVVAAMGNEYNDGNPTEYPAAFSHEVIAVGATNQNPVRADFSNTGPHINVSAPGVGIYTTVRGNLPPYNPSGTSFSTPIVSGVAGLILSQGLDRNFNLTNDDVRHILEITADDISPAGFDENTGYGKVNAYEALKLLDEPNVLYHGTSYGGNTAVTNLDQWIYTGSISRWGLSSGTYLNVDRYEVSKHIDFDVPFCSVPKVWLRDRECISLSFANPNDGFPWAEITNVTTTGFDVRYAAYYVRYNSLGQTINMWVPASPGSTKIEYTAVGVPNLAATAGPISGTDIICTSNSMFTLQNRPSGTTVSWTNSSNLTYVSGQGTDNYTVRAASSTAIGVGWVKAIVSNSCGNNTLEKTVWVGKPITPIIICPFNIVGLNSLIEVLAASPGADNYSWSVGGGTITSGQGTSDIWIMTSSHCLYDLTIRLTTSNSCGSSAQTMKSVPFDCSGGVNPLSVSPNPASQTITVELKDTPATTTAEIAGAAFTIKLLNSYNKPVYQKKVKSKRFTINVSKYRAGIYYLQVIKGNKVYVKTVIITD